jgi:hypothetical protein
LPHLIAKHTRGKEPLIDYFQSHVMITIEYLNILKGKTLNKPIVKKIREGKKNEQKINK